MYAGLSALYPGDCIKQIAIVVQTTKFDTKRGVITKFRVGGEGGLGEGGKDKNFKPLTRGG